MKQSLDQIFNVNQTQKPSLDELFGKAPVEPKQNFGERLLNQYDTARKDIGTAIEKGATGKQNLLSTGLQTAGNVAKAAFAPVTAAIEPLLEPVMQKVAQNPTAQKVFGTISDFASKNPELSKNIEAGLDIAGLGVTGQATKVVKGAANIAQDGVIGARNIAGKGLQNVGEKIQQTVIKPSGRDLADGFKIENVAKYDVGGSLPQTVAKTHTKMNELSNALKEKLLDTDARLDLNKAFDETAQKLLASKTKSFGENGAIMRQLDSLKKEIQSLPTENGTVDLYDATNIKRGAGTKGAWAYNRPEIDATATEKIYTEFYNTLKNEIELLAPDGVKEINKQLSELIPINNAALRRLPVAERNNAISLTDTIGLTSSMFDPRTLLILGAQKASKSGRVGQALVKAGEAIKAAPRVIKKPKPGISERSPILKGVKKYIKNPKMGLSIEDISKNIDNTDRDIMNQFVDAKLGKLEKLTPELKGKAQDLADSMGIKAFGTDESLAKEFIKILDADRGATKKKLKVK